MNQEILQIGIIEDTDIIRKNLVSFINMQGDMQISVEANSIEDFFDKHKQQQNLPCDILLLDIGLPGQSGLEALPAIKQLLPDTEVIILTIFEEEHIIVKALCNGASSYISKKAGLQEILNAIHIVKEKGSYLSPSVAREIVNHLMGGKVSKATILSDRQKEILKKLSEGKSYQTISNELFLSIETIRSHVKKMYKVLHVNNKTEAIANYLNGYIK
jgi:two-component system, NarL family, response regulator LiaR